MSSAEESAAEFARDIALAQANAPTAETLAALDAMNQRVLASGLVYVAKPEFIPVPETDEAFRKRMGQY